jgi:hypothetical protein
MCLTESEDIKGTITIEGLLVPAGWDEGGEIVSIAISTYSEEEYLIERNPKGEGLFAFVRQRGKLIGLTKMDNLGRKIITVEEYEILEE